MEGKQNKSRSTNETKKLDCIWCHTTEETALRGANGWKEVLPTLKEATIESELVWDTEAVLFQKLLASFLEDTHLEFLFLDGPVTVNGSQGLRAVCGVFKFSRDEQLDGALLANVSFKPTYGTVKPSWYVVAGQGGP